MKTAITILIVIGVLYGGWQFLEYYDRVSKEQDRQAEVAAAQQINEFRLSGMNSALEPAYREAREKGLTGLRAFLGQYKGTPHLLDPRLAYIELDYLLLLAVNRPEEARTIFQEVRNRLSTNSPVYRRVKALEPQFK